MNILCWINSTKRLRKFIWSPQENFNLAELNSQEILIIEENGENRNLTGKKVSSAVCVT